MQCLRLKCEWMWDWCHGSCGWCKTCVNSVGGVYRRLRNAWIVWECVQETKESQRATKMALQTNLKVEHQFQRHCWSMSKGCLLLFYGRFIDDVFGIWTHGEDTLLQFFDHANSCHRDIAFTYEYGISVPYLHVRATIANSQIVTDLYEKPTNTHQYLLPTSNHPPHICKNLPYGLGLRLRVIISEHETLELRLKELSAFLTARGYSEGLVAKQFDRVRQKSREALLNTNREKAPVADYEQTRSPLVCRWSSILPPLQPLLKSAFPILEASKRTKELFDFPSWRTSAQRTLRSFGTHLTTSTSPWQKHC